MLTVGSSGLYGLAEGAETGLSVASAFKDLTVFAALGSMTNVSAMPFNASRNTLIVFADHDKGNEESDKKTNHAAEELHRKGFNVLLTKPATAGQDFNQLLCEQGLDAVKAQAGALTLFTPEASLKPLSPAKGLLRQRVKKKHLEQELDF